MPFPGQCSFSRFLKGMEAPGSWLGAPGHPKPPRKAVRKSSASPTRRAHSPGSWNRPKGLKRQDSMLPPRWVETPLSPEPPTRACETVSHVHLPLRPCGTCPWRHISDLCRRHQPSTPSAHGRQTGQTHPALDREGPWRRLRPPQPARVPVGASQLWMGPSGGTPALPCGPYPCCHVGGG